MKLEEGRAPMLFGLILFFVNFFYVVLVEGVPLNFTKIILAMAIGAAKPIYALNPLVGTYFFLFNFIYQTLWLLITILGVGWMVQEGKNGAIEKQLDEFLKKRGSIYNNIFLIAILGPLLAIIFVWAIVAAISIFHGINVELSLDQLLDWKLVA
ncbi:MAG: hypothetical protein NUV67_01940 [archaeon]|nr:hypothetical protein [archaeon]